MFYTYYLSQLLINVAENEVRNATNEKPQEHDREAEEPGAADSVLPQIQLSH